MYALNIALDIHILKYYFSSDLKLIGYPICYLATLFTEHLVGFCFKDKRKTFQVIYKVVKGDDSYANNKVKAIYPLRKGCYKKMDIGGEKEK
jgi:hypothetical protein